VRPSAGRYVVIREDEIVGWTDLEFPLTGGTHAAGIFHPGPAFKAVRPVFDLYDQAGREDREAIRSFARARDALGLTVFEWGDLPLAAQVLLITVSDRRAVHMLITDERYWSRFPELRTQWFRPREA
jgi:hypothetical protein